MVTGTSSSGHPASPPPRQQGIAKRSRSLPLPSASRRRHTPTSSMISTAGTSRTHSRIPTPLTSRENSASPPLKPGPKPSSSRSSSNTRTSKIKGQESFPSETVKGKNPIMSRSHGHLSTVLHIPRSSLSLIRDTGEGYDFGLPLVLDRDYLPSEHVDTDKLDRLIEEKCAPLRKEIASVTQDLLDLKSQVATLEANPKEMQKNDPQSESVAEPQTARQKEKSPQKEFKTLTYASASETAQVLQVVPEGSKFGESRNDTQAASRDIQDTMMKLRDEIDKLRNKNRELEEKLRARRSENAESVQTQEDERAAAENKQFQPNAHQYETNRMDLDQEASGPSNPQPSGQSVDISSQQKESLPQQVSLEMIQRFSQEQEPFEDPPDPDNMVTEVHTNQEMNGPQVQGTATGNDPPIETGSVQHGPIITQHDVPLAQGYRGPSVPVQNTIEERSNEVSRLGETDIIRVQSHRVRRHHHRDMSIHEEQALQTRSRRRHRHHRPSYEERYPDDPRRSPRSHRRRRRRSELERFRNDWIKTRHHRIDGDRKIPIFVRVFPVAERMFFPDKYRRK